jgi:AbrB family looped-hinge helix DNA binding protein
MADLVTTVSTKGQVILPKAIRDHRKWRAGTKLTVEETRDGVLLRAVPVFPRTELKDVAGMLAYKGPPISIEDMEKAGPSEAERGNYDRR